MKLFRNLSIKYKIAAIGLMGVIGFVLYWSYNYSVSSLNAQRLSMLSEVAYPLLEKTDRNIVRLSEVKANFETAAGTAEEEYLELASNQASELRKSFRDIIHLDESLSGDVSKIIVSFDAFFEVASELTTGMVTGNIEMAALKTLADRMNTTYKSTDDMLGEFRDQRHQTFVNTIDATNHSLHEALILGVILLVVTVVFLIGVTVFVERAITNDLRHVVSSLKEMVSGGGDLTRTLSSRGADEVGELVQSFNAFVGMLRSIVSEVKGSASDLSVATQQMTVTASQNKERAENQYAETTKVGRSIDVSLENGERMASKVTDAAQAVSEADADAASSQEVIVTAVSAIRTLTGQIERSAQSMDTVLGTSERVWSILDVIQQVAEQTNLLALNAAIEAARAGEAGRGFAVVADEVRGLATRTTKSTLQIRETIEELQSGISDTVDIMKAGKDLGDDGMQKAGMASDALQQIIGAVSNLNTFMDEIASQAKEQGAVTECVRGSISEIQETAEQTAGESQSVANASGSLETMADNLSGLVSQFKV